MSKMFNFTYENTLGPGLDDYFNALGISKNVPKAADLLARREVSTQLLLWIIDGSPTNPLKPPVDTFSLRASGSAHVSTYPAHYTSDSSIPVVDDGEATPNRGATKATRDTLTVGFNTPYAAKWELNDFTPGETSIANGPTGPGWLRSHIQSDAPDVLRQYAFILKRESGG